MSDYPRIILGVSSTQIYKNTDDDNLNFYNNNMNVISLDSSGNVGIGDITPGYKLDVNGTGRFTSDLTVDGDLTVSGTTITMNASTIEVEDPLISLSSNNSADVTDIGFYGQYNDGSVKYTGLIRDASDSGQYKLFKELQEEPTTTINTAGTGYTLADFECANINLTGDISINGVVQSFGDSNIWSEENSTATYSNNVSIGNDLTLTNDFFIGPGSGSSTNTFFVDRGNNLVNISGSFDVWDKFHVDSNAIYAENGIVSLSNTLSGPIIDTQGTNIRLSSTGNVGALTINSSGETLLTGKLGIGTNSPNYLLHLHDDNSQIHLTNSYTGSTTNDGTLIGLSAATFYIINNELTNINLDTGNDISLRTGGTERLNVNQNGNVGIGTSNPGDKLHIYENANDAIQLKIENAYASSRAGISLVNDSGTFNIQCNGGSAIIENHGSGSTNFYQKSTGGYNFKTTDSNTDRLVITNDGSVGIGDFTPTIDLAIGDSDTGFHSMGDGELAWYSNNTRRAYLTSEGNLCIGNRDIRDEVANTGLSEALIFTDNNSYADDRYFLTCWQDANNTHQMGMKFDYYTGSGGTANTHTRIDFVSNAQNDQAINDGGMYTSHRFYSNGFTQIYRDSTSATTDCLKILSNYGSTETTVAIIEANGDYESLSNSYGGVSDIRLKENIVDANSQWEDVKSIKFRKFNFRNTPNQTHMGVVAQELELTSPGLIKTRNDEIGTKSVKTSIMYMKGMKALQESMLRIENLEKDTIKENVFGESLLRIRNLEAEGIKERVFIKNIINSKNKYKVFSESTFSKIIGTYKPLDIINDMSYIQYMDNNNNIKQSGPEVTPLYYGIGEESLQTYMNVYDKDTNRILPTIYKKGKLVNDEIELYNHLLNEGEEILVKFTIDNVKYEEEILVTEIIDTTHIKIDNTKLQQYFDHINNRNIFIYGTREKNVNILNEKFLYSLSSLSLSGIKELTTRFNNKNEETLELINTEKQENNKQNIQIQSNTENVNNIATKFNTLVQEHMVVKDLVQKSAETINKLLVENNNLKNTINTLNNEKELNKKNIVLLNDNFNKQNNINQNNLNLLNEHIKKQQSLINQLMEKVNNVSL